MTDALEASAAQEKAYQAVFDGTTNRPIQPLNGRTIDKHTPVPGPPWDWSTWLSAAR